MPYLRALAVLLFVALLAGGAALQDKDKDKAVKDKEVKDKEVKDKEVKDKEVKDKDKKIKGSLPANYKQLGLTDAQKQKIYKIRNDYKDKLEELEKTKAKLKPDH